MAVSEHALPKTMEVGPADRKMRIAFVYSRMPFPMMRGDQLTVAHLLSFLAARGHQVDFFTLDADGHATEAQSQWLSEVCRTVKIYPHGKIAKAAGILLGLFNRLPMQVGVFNNPSLKRDVRKGVIEGKYDVVYVYYLRSAEVINSALDAQHVSARAGHATATFLAMQLSQTLNTRRILKNCTGVVKKIIYGIELKLVCRYESRVWRRFTRSVLIGDCDVEAIKQVCRSQNVPEIDNWIYGAHGTDVGRFYPASPHEIVPNRVVFSGSMLYAPNVQAIQWFVANCWDQILTRVPSAQLIIQGRDPVPEIQRLNGSRGIDVTGTVPDVGAMIRSAAVCINPMLAAGGMQNKLIEYLACGKAVVATAIANEGIRAVPSQHFLEANTAEEFVDSVLALFHDQQRAEQLGNAGRKFVLDNWTWEAHFLKLEKDMLAALRGNASPELGEEVGSSSSGTGVLTL